MSLPTPNRISRPSALLPSDRSVHPGVDDVDSVDGLHGGRGMLSILARLRAGRAQPPAPFKESDLDPLPPAWSVLGDL